MLYNEVKKGINKNRQSANKRASTLSYSAVLPPVFLMFSVVSPAHMLLVLSVCFPCVLGFSWAWFSSLAPALTLSTHLQLVTITCLQYINPGPACFNLPDPSCDFFSNPCVALPPSGLDSLPWPPLPLQILSVRSVINLTFWTVDGTCLSLALGSSFTFS